MPCICLLSADPTAFKIKLNAIKCKLVANTDVQCNYMAYECQINTNKCEITSIYMHFSIFNA